ncbi:hypothetical protein ACJ73_07283, partial [Blastomyces percursus]
GWGLNKTTAGAPKTIARRYYQLKTGHAAIGAHLYRINARESPQSLACGAPRETTRHALIECRHWRRQREHLYKLLGEQGVIAPTDREETSEVRLLQDDKAALPLLRFLESTEIGSGCRDQTRARNREELSDEWGWPQLEERHEDRDGER